jgi:hypothetical protein
VLGAGNVLTSCTATDTTCTCEVPPLACKAIGTSCTPSDLCCGGYCADAGTTNGCTGTSCVCVSNL